jgi:hypothetical protein
MRSKWVGFCILMERLEFCEMVPSLLNRLSNTTSHGNVEKSLDFYFLFFLGGKFTIGKENSLFFIE